jgi:DNA repair protein RadC
MGKRTNNKGLNTKNSRGVMNNQDLKTIEYANKSASEYLTIREWRQDDKPRERLQLFGAQCLSDSELLAILINTGMQNFSALDIARSMLKTFTTLSDLGSRSVKEMCTIKGIGMAKAIGLSAAFELGRRYQQEEFNPSHILHTPHDVAKYFIPRMRGARTESFYIAMLNTANIVISIKKISEGSLNSSVVHPREVFRIAVIESAASIIALHNHPSGNTEPSKEDISLTKQIALAGSMMSIQLLDHIIIAGETFTSLRERGYLE